MKQELNKNYMKKGTKIFTTKTNSKVKKTYPRPVDTIHQEVKGMFKHFSKL